MAEREYTITAGMLQRFDALYTDAEYITPTLRSHQRRWGHLVDELREIRRRVEAGVTVKIEGTDTLLTTWQEFYNWAHGRYHALEDGCDLWIGDDRS